MLYTPEQTAGFSTHALRYVHAELVGHVLRLTLNRPEKKNALNPTLLNELAFALTYAKHEKQVWMVVLAAAGDVFCAGMDLKSLSSGEKPEETVPPPAGPVRLAELLADLHKPSLAQVQGSVYAGGFLLVAGCTYVIAAESVRFSLPEVKRGLFPFQVMASLLEIMPARTVLDLCLRARTLSAADARAVGLVTHRVPDDQVEKTVQDLLEELQQHSPTAMQWGLRAYQQLKTVPADQQQAFLLDQFRQIQQTADAREGMAAFLAKRLPKWEGE